MAEDMMNLRYNLSDIVARTDPWKQESPFAVTGSEGKTQSEWTEEITDAIAKTCKDGRKQEGDDYSDDEDGYVKMRRLGIINKRIRHCLMREYSITSMYLDDLLMRLGQKLKQYFWFFVCGVSTEMEEMDEKRRMSSSSPPPTPPNSDEKEYPEVSVILESEDSPLRKILVSPSLIKDFVAIAKPNLDLNLEIGAVLAGKLELDGKYHITALLVPVQKCKSYRYEALNEGALHRYCETHSLMHIGEIHTHPSQKCYLSSVDLHNHFWFQNELPEAISIVVSPADSTRRFGVFRITDPGGMSVLRKCDTKQTVFHIHENSSSEPIYKECSKNVLFDPYIRYSVVDFRSD